MTGVRGEWRLALATALAAAAVFTGVAPASAHDELIGATPADGAVVEVAPLTIVLEFFEPIGSARSAPPTLELRDDEGAATALDVSSDDRTVTGLLPRRMSTGTYEVAWSVKSDDGHMTDGVTRFAISEPSTSMEYTDATTDSSTALWFVVTGAAAGAALVAAAVVVLRRRRAS